MHSLWGVPDKMSQTPLLGSGTYVMVASLVPEWIVLYRDIKVNQVGFPVFYLLAWPWENKI